MLQLDFPVSVSHGLATREHLKQLDLFGIAVEILAFDLLLMVLRHR